MTRTHQFKRLLTLIGSFVLLVTFVVPIQPALASAPPASPVYQQDTCPDGTVPISGTAVEYYSSALSKVVLQWRIDTTLDSGRNVAVGPVDITGLTISTDMLPDYFSKPINITVKDKPMTSMETSSIGVVTPRSSLRAHRSSGWSGRA